MIPLVLTEAIEAMGGFVRVPPPACSVRGVSTDSRSIGEGDLFFALAGPNFDGHAYVADAFRGGAIAAVVAADAAAKLTDSLATASEPRISGGALIVVDSPLAALGRLARFHRRLLSANVIAVVGSNGKTTTKGMIDHVLSARLKGRSSPKSYNNDVGVPLTLLSASLGDDFLVVEIGTNAPGEIAALAELAEPNMAVLTSIGEEHLEKLRDLRGVAAEECSVFGKLRPGGFAAVNIDSPLVRERLPDKGVTVVTFGREADADLRVTSSEFIDGWLQFELNGRFPYRLPMPGAHNASNAAGVAAIARRVGLEHAEIAARLETFRAPPLRGEIQAVGGLTVINDAYNANPHSVAAAIELLESFPCRGRRFFVLGEMRELGERSEELHRAVVQRLLKSRLDQVVLVGAASASVSGEGRSPLVAPKLTQCADLDECAAFLGEAASDGDVVLLKASRAVGLDKLAEKLRSLKFATSVA